jgi:hypothetical protein
MVVWANEEKSPKWAIIYQICGSNKLDKNNFHFDKTGPPPKLASMTRRQ